VKKITINEVGLRDGLQSQRTPVPTQSKLAMIERLAGIGFETIEIASFVNPKLMPSMADSREITRRAYRNGKVRYRGFTPNVKGFDIAAEAGIDEVGVAIAASDTFNQKNIRCDAREALKQAADIAGRAKDKGIAFGGCIATAVYCPFEGYIKPERVITIAEQLLEMGCEAIYLGETIGRARPEETYRLLNSLRNYVPLDKVGAHFHDTWGQGIANYSVCLEAGITSFDTSLGGLGGCPFAPGAAGNVATEDLLYLLESEKYQCDLDLLAVSKINREFCQENALPYNTKAGNACLRSLI